MGIHTQINQPERLENIVETKDALTHSLMAELDFMKVSVHLNRCHTSSDNVLTGPKAECSSVSGAPQQVI